MIRASLISVSLLFSIPGVALAAGGGGGGSSSAPVSSGPKYDPVEEYQSGVQHLKEQDYAKAERAFKRVTKVARKDANSHYLLGLSHLGQEEWKPAEKSLQRALKYNTELYDARARLVITLEKLDKSDAAKAELSKLKTAATECAETCANAEKITKSLALANSIYASPTEASEAPSETEAEPVETSALPESLTNAKLAQSDLAYLDAVRQINLANYEGAVATLETTLLNVGPHPELLTYLGFAHRKQGLDTAAVHYYSVALSVDPNHLGVNEYLGEFYLERGDLVAAQTQLAKLEELCPFGCAEAEMLSALIADAKPL